MDEFEDDEFEDNFDPNDTEEDLDDDFDPNDTEEDLDDDFDPNDTEEDLDDDFDPNDTEEDLDDDFDPNDTEEDLDDDFDPNDTEEDLDDDFDPNDNEEDIDDDFNPNGNEEKNEENEFEQIDDGEGIGAEENNFDKEKGEEEQSEEGYHENISSESTCTVLVSENKEEMQEADQDELEREIEKELEEGVEGINKYLEEEAEFINAYQEMVGKERELDQERELEGEERQKTDEEWEKEVETAAYTAEQLYESTKEIETNTINEEISDIEEELENEKEVELSEEISEPQLSDLKEEISELYEELYEEKDEVEQHQVEYAIQEELETELEPIINEKEVEKLQELDIEEQFPTVHFKEYIDELVERQDEEAERLKEQVEKEELEAQTSKIKEANFELYEEVEVERDELDQHEVEATIEEELETIPEPIINEKEVEKLQELDIEEQFQTVHFKEYIDELLEKQDEDKNIENDKIKQEKENIEQTQDVIHQSTYLQEKLEEQEEELEWEYEEKDMVEQHQVEATIEEELKTEPKPIIDEEELEYIKSLEPEKQLEAEIFYEFIEELANKQNEEKEEREENEEKEEISTEQKVAQIMCELDIPQKINSGETEVELNSQEGELEQETASPDEKVVEEREIEENKDHQQELEEILEQIRKIEQEALNEIEQEEEDLDKNAEKNYERAKNLYKQQTGKRPIYANKETKGFIQWLEQKKKSEEKEKPKQKKEIKEEQKKEETWKWFLKNWIEKATEIDPELKSELKKLVEEYDELEKLIKKYSQLYNKAHHELLSQVEKNELKSLIKALQKIDHIKIELFLGIREIKRYLDGQSFFDFWYNPRVNRILHHIFTQLSQKYKNLKQAEKKKENSEKILKNWIYNASEEEISLELKTMLKEIVENYKEIEEMATTFMKLYKKEQLGQISQFEKVKLKSLIKTLEKLDPINIVIFVNIRAIKNYLNDQNFNDFSDKSRVNRLLSRFFAHLEQISYNTKDLIEDLRNEIQQLSEELAQIFPNRLVQKRGNAYSHTLLSRFWWTSDSYVSAYIIQKAKNDSDFIIKEKALLRLQEKLEEKLGAKALGCFQIIRRYQSKEINTLQFVDMLEKELGRVSGEIRVNNEELSLILAGTHGFIKRVLGTIRTPTHHRYNPHYKFSKERLRELRGFLFEKFGSRAKKCFDLLKRYELLNSDLKEYSHQQYTVENPRYFLNIDKYPEKSYWFGFLRADGSRAGKPHMLSIELAVKDKDRLEQFAEAVGFPLNRITFRTRYNWYKGKLKGYKSALLGFICKPMAKDIDDLGFQSSKAEQKFVPDYVVQALKKAKKTSKQANIDWWLTIPGKVALAFLLGFYDGDGRYIGGRSAIIYASSEQFLEHIKGLFEIKNDVYTVVFPGEDAWAFDQKYVSKGMYSLTLGPELFDMMMNSYERSMKRKRPQPRRTTKYSG